MRNESTNPAVGTADMRERIGQVLGDSNRVRLVGQTAADFDYVLRSELTSVLAPSAATKGDDGYRLELQLFTISGEMDGQWCATLALTDGRRSCD